MKLLSAFFTWAKINIKYKHLVGWSLFYCGSFISFHFYRQGYYSALIIYLYE